MSSTKQNALDERARIDLVLALLGGETTVAEAAEEHGLDPSELETWTELYLDGLRHAAHAGRTSLFRRLARTARRRPIAITGGALAALAVLLVPVTALSETPEGCTDATNTALCLFVAGEPAVAAEVNSNFTKLLGWLQSKVGGVDDPGNITTGTIVAAGTGGTPGTVSADTVSAATVDATGVTVGGDGLDVDGQMIVHNDSLIFMTLIEMGEDTGDTPVTYAPTGGAEVNVSTDDWNCFVGGVAMLGGVIEANGSSGNPLFAYTYPLDNVWMLAADLRSPSPEERETHTIGVVCVSALASRVDDWWDARP